MVPRRAIFFDWDGTIVDSVPALFETDAAICRELGLPFDQAIFRRTFSPNWRRMYQALGIADSQVEQAVQVWSETFHSGDANPFPGVKRALTRLAACGYLLGLVTGGSRDEIEPQLERLGLAGVLTARVYGDDPIAGKPHPEPLLLALDRAGGVAPADAIYVGDALDDMRMAAAAGSRGVGVVSMLAGAEELIDAGASETAPSVADWVLGILGPEFSPPDVGATSRHQDHVRRQRDRQ
jgi:phosphoglycolate phosphatase